MSGSVCIITARGGSKRIPRKNVKEFCGKPIIAYSIEAALESKLFDEVMVSTDDDEMAGVARRCGASVPFMRSAEASDDFATTADVISEVLARYSSLGRAFDVVCCLYPTAPFVTTGKLRRAFMMLEEGADSVLPVVRFGFPPQRGLVVDDGALRYACPECASARSQDLRPVYHDCGQFYMMRAEAFARDRSVVAGRAVPMELPEAEVQDIDNPADWDLAELKYERMARNGQA